MQTGLYLFEGLRAAGLRLAELPETPYREYHATQAERLDHLDTAYQAAERLDTLQFPFQTLAYRNGDLDDLGLLYGALLEASGISAAFVPLEDDFITAVNLGISPSSAETLFNGNEKLLIIADQVWLPFSMAAFNRGFMESWKAGAQHLAAAEGDFKLVIPEDAWEIYTPVSIPSRENPVLLPPEQLVLSGAEKELRSYITGELDPLIEKMRNQMRTATTAVNYNRLGLLLLRSGKQAEAASAYERAAAMGYSAAMSNRGNISLLDRDYQAAEKWFRQALAADGGNRAAKEGLEKARQQ
jgi:tetratricopeptide (TPR) repeat protein